MSGSIATLCNLEPKEEAKLEIKQNNETLEQWERDVDDNNYTPIQPIEEPPEGKGNVDFEEDKDEELRIAKEIEKEKKRAKEKAKKEKEKAKRAKEKAKEKERLRKEKEMAKKEAKKLERENAKKEAERLEQEKAMELARAKEEEEKAKEPDPMALPAIKKRPVDLSIKDLQDLLENGSIGSNEDEKLQQHSRHDSFKFSNKGMDDDEYEPDIPKVSKFYNFSCHYSIKLINSLS